VLPPGRKRSNHCVIVDIQDRTPAARRFGDQLLEAPRAFADRTSISGAIDFAATRFDGAPYESDRRTIDVSGDGNNNAGALFQFGKNTDGQVVQNGDDETSATFQFGW
jgi:hypothetical protein